MVRKLTCIQNTKASTPHPTPPLSLLFLFSPLLVVLLLRPPPHVLVFSWPLQDASILKKKFDEIFDSSRYSKALKVLQDNKKSFNLQVKDLKADVAGLTSHKHAANMYRRDITKYNKQLDSVDEEKSDIIKSIKDCENEKQHLEEIMSNISEILNLVESKRNEKTQELAVVQKQRQLLSEDYTSTKSLKELYTLLSNFDDELDKRLSSETELKDEVSKLQLDIKKLNSNERTINTKKSKLEIELETHKTNLKTRYDKMVSIGTTYGLDNCLTQIGNSQQSQGGGGGALLSQSSTSFRGGTGTGASMSMLTASQDDQDITAAITVDDMKEFYRHLSKKENELKDKLDECRQRNQIQEDDIQSQLSDLIGKQKSINSDRSKLNQEQKSAQDEIRTIMTSQKSGGSGDSGGVRIKKIDIDELKQRATKVNKERDVANNNPRRQEIPIEIRSFETKIDKLARLIDDGKLAI